MVLDIIVLIVTQEGIVSKKKHVRHFLNVFFFQAEDGIRDYYASRGLGDVYKRQWSYLGP